jgi:precorrin-3B methylase
MKKKIAVLVRDRKHEALRMAVGATLSNDVVNVFIMDHKLEIDDEIDVNLQMLSDLNVSIFTNNPENRFEQRSTENIADMLSEYDIVIPY